MIVAASQNTLVCRISLEADVYRVNNDTTLALMTKDRSEGSREAQMSRHQVESHTS